MLEREPNEFTDPNLILQTAPQRTSPVRFFHIQVRNRHRAKLATNCTVYLEKATLLPNAEMELKTVEFKWAGTRMPSVGIAPGGIRLFDAFFLFRNDTSQVNFNALTDATDYLPVFPKGVADYELSYVVLSENFAPARKTFTLRLSHQLDNVTFQ